VITDNLAVEIAQLSVLRETSAVGALYRVADLASRTVTGCAGATVTRWSGPAEGAEAGPSAATQPELAELLEIQHALRDGPSYRALHVRHHVTCADTLTETRWPRYTAAALRRGIRCTATVVHHNEEAQVTLTMYGITAGALDFTELPLASLLTAQGGVAVANTAQFDDVHRAAVQLQEAVESHAVVDQACGVLMHALGCDAEAALARLRALSQTRHVKLTALARRIVDADNRSRI
jgi:hypothetical protein